MSIASDMKDLQDRIEVLEQSVQNMAEAVTRIHSILDDHNGSFKEIIAILKLRKAAAL